jgi:glycosyltransferase involved in cell wall biosynthesis
MKIIWHSNAPWFKTGYGQQTDIWTERIRSLGHDVAIHGYAGAQHMAVEWKGMTVFPAGVENAIGMDALGYYYELHQADLVISLCDAWALSPRLMALMNTVCWTPVDAEPLGQGLRTFFDQSGARPLAMSRYGQRLFREAGYQNCGYIPHGLPMDVFRPPENRDALRAASGYAPETFVVGMNQANRSGLRKALPEQIMAFARFHERHPDSKLMLHMARDHPKGQDLPLLLERLGIPEGVVFFPDAGVYSAGLIGMEQMPDIYGALDVLLQCPMAGGFELPALEAQACGVPVIATDGTAVREVAGPHSRLVKGQPFWVEERHAGFWTMPLIDDIDAALEEAWQAREDGTIEARRAASREHALRYDADVILRDYWAPYLEDMESRLHGRRRVRRPAPEGGRTVWSPVMLNGELDMLAMRLHETGGWISRHVIAESWVTHRGVAKPLYYRDSQGRFEAHASRITAVTVPLADAGGSPWENEHAQRDAAWPVIDAEAADDDIVLICDVDEIPSPSLLERAKAGELPEVCSVRTRTFLHAVDWEVPPFLVPPAYVVATAGYIRAHGGSLAAIRDSRNEYPVVTDGGWHFSWTGGPSAAAEKLATATCHTELLGTGEGDLIADGTRYRDGTAGREGLPVKAAEVDETWPEWITSHQCPPEWFRPKDWSDTTLIITAYQRPDYLEQVLTSWAAADGITGLRRIVVALAPSDVEAEQREVVAKFAALAGRDVEIWMDSPACAAVPGPHRAIAEAANQVLAGDPGTRFLVFGEEDIQVSSDVLRFLLWARQEAAGRAIAVCAHNPLGNGWQPACDDSGAAQDTAALGRSFSPWVWGTWRRTWERVIEPDWDYDCRKGPRPDQHGYDWQMQRITEREGDVLAPAAARSQNIGRDGGVFAHPEKFAETQAASFREVRGHVDYRLEEA